VLMVDDVVTSGGAKLEAAAPFRDAGLVVEDVVVIVDRSDGAAIALAAAGLRVHSALTVRELFDDLRAQGAVSAANLDRALTFLSGGH